MKKIAREWLNAANDDLLFIEARYPGDLGLMPHGKPGIDEAEIYKKEAMKIKERIETFLINK